MYAIYYCEHKEQSNKYLVHLFIKKNSNCSVTGNLPLFELVSVNFRTQKSTGLLSDWRSSMNVLLLLCTICSFIIPIHAQTNNWICSSALSIEWATPSCWSFGTVPTSGNDVYIASNSTSTINIFTNNSTVVDIRSLNVNGNRLFSNVLTLGARVFVYISQMYNCVFLTIGGGATLVMDTPHTFETLSLSGDDTTLRVFKSAFINSGFSWKDASSIEGPGKITFGNPCAFNITAGTLISFMFILTFFRKHNKELTSKWSYFL